LNTEIKNNEVIINNLKIDNADLKDENQDLQSTLLEKLNNDNSYECGNRR